ncbi:MAG: hypothetical protein ACRDHG_08355 [Anaerolineales bacterium]
MGGNPGAEAAGYLDSELVSGIKRGYVLSYAATDSNHDGVRDLYTIHANPEKPGHTGERYFFTDQSGVIRFESGRQANASSQPIR